MAKAQTFDDNYRVVEGWNIHYESALARTAPEKLQHALQLLELKLTELNKVVPEKALAKLKDVHFWVSANANNHSTVYHPSAQWLSSNGRNPAMAKGIQLQNIDNFLTDAKTQPMAILHELAHAYHQRIGLRDQNRIMKAYQNAMEKGLYKKVTRYGGRIKDVTAYAMNNEKEYFAELSEAYFGVNDYYPYTRDELEKYDPEGFTMLQAVWK
ncbi:MAG: hypothetical protein ACOYNL_03380 [Rickettsiales bacterium]